LANRTIVIMHQFKAAQPALLYLSPACILSVTLVALLRGEFQTFWQFTDEDEEALKKDKEDSTATSINGKDEQSNGHGIDVATSTSTNVTSDGSLRRR
jgi:minor histocompatibility antigen H13